MILIYSEKHSPRLNYILNYLLVERLGLSYELTIDFDFFEKSELPKINYSGVSALKGFHIIPEGLLFEQQIRESKPEVKKDNEQILIFPDEGSEMGFDLFSASFWMLSRYEELQPFHPDIHQRFPANESLAFKQQFLNRPVVDEWVVLLKEKLKIRYPKLIFKEEAFEVIPTIDIDSPWSYKHKGIFRTIGGMFRDGLKMKWNLVFQRIKVLLSIQHDPFFTFYWLAKLFQKLRIEPLYFVLLGDYGKFDKTIDYRNREFQHFLKSLDSHGKPGLHPSYRASNNPEVFKIEIQRFETIYQRKLKATRQHFLKIQLPDYYEYLGKLGIEEDYTMGFADAIGFRAGTSRPFRFYNLKLELESPIHVFPFSVMDRTMSDYLKLNEKQSFEKVKEIIANIRKVNGSFVSLWHNESLSNQFEWKGWRDFYEQMLVESIGNHGN